MLKLSYAGPYIGFIDIEIKDERKENIANIWKKKKETTTSTTQPYK